MRWQQLADFQPLPVGSVRYALSHEPGQFVIVDLLQLASATLAEMAARRSLMMRAMDQGTIALQNIAGRRTRGEAPIAGYAVALGSKADNQAGFDIGGFGHRQAA